MSSSSRVYLVSGSILRVRRYPRSSLPRALAASHITKPRLPQHSIRACSGWRRGGGGPHWRGAYHQDNAGAKKLEDSQRGPSPWENSPHELSRREKMWRERMDRIRRMMEHDPYEALFGYSNRLLKGMRGDLLNEQDKWWQREMSFTVKNPFAGKKVEIQAEHPGPIKSEEPAKGGADEASVKAAKPATAAEVEPEPELEYDPISNRMVRKSTNPIGRYEQHHTIVIGPYNGEGKVYTQYGELRAGIGPTQQPQSQNAELSKDEAIDIPVKPYRRPSFTMLKEDLPQEPTMTTPSTQAAAPEPVSSARAEYEEYKAKRLSEAVKSKQWLKDEGFGDLDISGAGLSSHGQRTDMEKQFNRLHSSSQELAEKQLLEKKPSSAQRSQGTSVSRPSFAEWREKVTVRMSAYNETRADQEIHEYTMQVAGDNLRNKRLAEENNSDGDKAPHKPLVHPSPDAKANKDVLDYAKQVASDNIKTKRLADRATEKQQTADLLAEVRRKQFAKFNKESRDLAEWNKQSLELRKPALTALERVKRTIQEAKDAIERAQVAEKTPAAAEEGSPTPARKPLETSLQRHQDKSVAAESSPLKTSLQRLSKEEAAPSTSAKSTVEATTEQVRTHDPVGYNHARESGRLQQLASQPAKKPFKVPSLAEVFGYKKAQAEDAKPAAEKNEIDPSASWLLSEVESQKNAFTNFESSSRKPAADAEAPKVETPQASTEAKESITQRVNRELEQKKKDAALVREIRYIYEDKYGPITTSHVQPVEVAVEPPVEKVAEAKVVPETAVPLPDVEAVKETETAKETASPKDTPAPLERKPAATLTTPTPARTAKYTILAYDSKSKNMTTASFESIPSATESSIPATIALRHLAYANRFLAKLIELQHRGFTPVHAERNLLILRQDASKTAEKAFDASEEPVKTETPAEDAATETATAKEPKRLEPVFSGKPSHRNMEKAWRRWKEAKRQARQARRRRFGRAVKFVAGGVVLSGAVIYLAGVGAEVRHNRGRGKVVVSDEKRSWYDHSREELEAAQRKR